MVFEIERSAVAVLDVECNIYFRSVTMKLEFFLLLGSRWSLCCDFGIVLLDGWVRSVLMLIVIMNDCGIWISF